jgi:hypothetical protein
MIAQIPPPPTWAGAAVAFCLAIPMVCTVILQIMARLDANREREDRIKQREEDAKAAAGESQKREDEAKMAQQGVASAQAAAAMAHTAATRAADEAAKVKTVLEESTAATDKKLDENLLVTHATHTLVNSQYGALLQKTAYALRRIAELPGATDADKSAAGEADAALAEHKGKQAVVDAGDAAAAAAAAAGDGGGGIRTTTTTTTKKGGG